MLLEKVFHVNKEKLMLHKKGISCRQKQDVGATKKDFVLKKVIFYLKPRAVNVCLDQYKYIHSP